MAQTKIGVFVEGKDIYAVEVAGPAITNKLHLNEKTLDEGIRKLLHTLRPKKKTVNVVLSSPMTDLRPIKIVNSSPSEFRRQIAAALIDLSVIDPASNDTAIAGIVLKPTGTGEYRPVVSSKTSITDVNRIYRPFGKVASKVTVPEFTYTQDGLYLFISKHYIRTTLVKNGVPVVSRQLNLRGTDFLEAKLKNPQYLQDMYKGEKEHPEARRVVDEYVRTMVTELRSTYNVWSDSNNFIIPTSLTVVGELSQLSLVQDALEDLVPTVNKDLIDPHVVEDIAPSKYSGYAHAYLAANNVEALRPTAIFANPYEQQRLQAQVKTRKRNKRILIGAGITVLITSLLLFPVRLGVNAVNQAKNDKAKQETILNSYAAEDYQYRTLTLLDSQRKSLDKEDLQYQVVLQKLYDSSPGAARFNSLRISAANNQEIALTSTVTLPGSTYADLSSWITLLQDRMGPSHIWVESFTANEGNITATINLTIPATENK